MWEVLLREILEYILDIDGVIFRYVFYIMLLFVLFSFFVYLFVLIVRSL